MIQLGKDFIKVLFVIETLGGQASPTPLRHPGDIGRVVAAVVVITVLIIIVTAGIVAIIRQTAPTISISSIVATSYIATSVVAFRSSLTIYCYHVLWSCVGV